MSLLINRLNRESFLLLCRIMLSRLVPTTPKATWRKIRPGDVETLLMLLSLWRRKLIYLQVSHKGSRNRLVSNKEPPQRALIQCLREKVTHQTKNLRSLSLINPYYANEQPDKWLLKKLKMRQIRRMSDSQSDWPNIKRKMSRIKIFKKRSLVLAS